MRFMMLMIPKGYDQPPPGTMPAARPVAAMMRFNQSLQKAGVLLALDGLHPPSMGARVSFSAGRATVSDGAVRRGDGGGQRVLDDSGKVQARGDRLGMPVPGIRQ